MTKRTEILDTGKTLTSGDRDAQYGDPSVNLTASGALKMVMRDHMVRHLSLAEIEALDMVLTKMGRIITGPTIKRDNYVDMATYAAIAGEAAELAEERDKTASKATKDILSPENQLKQRAVIPFYTMDAGKVFNSMRPCDLPKYVVNLPDNKEALNYFTREQGDKLLNDWQIILGKNIPVTMHTSFKGVFTLKERLYLAERVLEREEYSS